MSLMNKFSQQTIVFCLIFRYNNGASRRSTTIWRSKIPYLVNARCWDSQLTCYSVNTISEINVSLTKARKSIAKINVRSTPIEKKLKIILEWGNVEVKCTLMTLVSEKHIDGMYKQSINRSTRAYKLSSLYFCLTLCWD